MLDAAIAQKISDKPSEVTHLNIDIPKIEILLKIGARITLNGEDKIANCFKAAIDLGTKCKASMERAIMIKRLMKKVSASTQEQINHHFQNAKSIDDAMPWWQPEASVDNKKLNNWLADAIVNFKQDSDKPAKNNESDAYPEKKQFIF